MLWLETYLKSYQNTVLLVSHDRAFLNEVCTDIILFKNQKLAYYRGDYDNFEGTRKEERIVQQRQHEAQMVKVMSHFLLDIILSMRKTYCLTNASIFYKGETYARICR